MITVVRVSVLLVFVGLVAENLMASESPASVPLDLPAVIAVLRQETPPQVLIQICEEQGVSFHCDRDALNELRKAGANSWLLNRISRHCRPVAADSVRAATAFSTGDYGEAASVATSVVEKCPRFLELLWIRGRARYELGQLDESQKDFESIRGFDPNYVFSWKVDLDEDNRPVDLQRHAESIGTLILETRLDAGEFDEVIYEASLNIDAGKNVSPLVFQLRGGAYQHLGHHERALADYSRSILHAPFNSRAWSTMSLLLSTTSSERLRNSKAGREFAHAALVLARGKVEQAAAHNALAGVTAFPPAEVSGFESRLTLAWF